MNLFWKNTFALLVIYLWGMLVRMFSKWCESKFFKDELRFPTTELLLWSDHSFSKAFKKALYVKIRKDSGLRLATPKDELRDECEARKLVVAAVAWMREKTRGDKIVFGYNVAYGFVRNLTAGSFLSFVAAFALLCLGFMRGEESALFAIGLLATLTYLLLMLLASPLCSFVGRLYAKALINAYYSLEV